MEIISMLFMTAITLLGFLYLIQIISGKRKPGDYENIPGISGYGAMLIILFGSVLLIKVFLGQQTIREYPILSALGICLIYWIACRVLVFGKDEE